jgi:hypothetical protein
MWKWFAAGLAAGWVLFDNPVGNALAAEIQPASRGGLTPAMQALGADGGAIPFQKGIATDGGKPGIGKGILIAI